MNFGGYGGDVHIPQYIFKFIIQKNRKSTTDFTYTKIKFYIILILKKICRMNNKKIMKRGPHWAVLLFLYEVSKAVLIDFIAMLITPGI